MKKKFEVGARYPLGPWVFKVIKRTKCFVTFEHEELSPFGKVRTRTERRKLYTYDGGREATFVTCLGYPLAATDPTI